MGEDVGNRQENVNGFKAGLVLGGLVGAGIALLYAPKRGTDLRRQIRSKANGSVKDLKRFINRPRKQKVSKNA